MAPALFASCFGCGHSSLVPPDHIELNREELKRLFDKSIALNNGRLIVHGIFARANTKNNNKRVYPKHILKREVAKFDQEHVRKGSALGELDHPNYASRYFKCLNLPNISHQVLEVHWRGELLWGTIEILPTPSGLLLWELYSQGIKLGVSSRGWASLRTDPKAKCVYVDGDFELITFDFVTEPSTRGAYLVPVIKPYREKVPNQSRAQQVAHLGHGVVSMRNIQHLPDMPMLVARINQLQGKPAGALLSKAQQQSLDQLLLFSHYLVFPQLAYLDKEQHARDFQSHLAMFATRAHLADQQHLMSRADLNAIILREIAKEEKAVQQQVQRVWAGSGGVAALGGPVAAGEQSAAGSGTAGAGGARQSPKACGQQGGARQAAVQLQQLPLLQLQGGTSGMYGSPSLGGIKPDGSGGCSSSSTSSSASPLSPMDLTSAQEQLGPADDGCSSGSCAGSSSRKQGPGQKGGDDGAWAPQGPGEVVVAGRGRRSSRASGGSSRKTPGGGDGSGGGDMGAWSLHPHVSLGANEAGDTAQLHQHQQRRRNSQGSGGEVLGAGGAAGTPPLPLPRPAGAGSLAACPPRPPSSGSTRPLSGLFTQHASPALHTQQQQQQPAQVEEAGGVVSDNGAPQQWAQQPQLLQPPAAAAAGLDAPQQWARAGSMQWHSSGLQQQQQQQAAERSSQALPLLQPRPGSPGEVWAAQHHQHYHQQHYYQRQQQGSGTRLAGLVPPPPISCALQQQQQQVAGHAHPQNSTQGPAAVVCSSLAGSGGELDVALEFARIKATLAAFGAKLGAARHGVMQALALHLPVEDQPGGAISLAQTPQQPQVVAGRAAVSYESKSGPPPHAQLKTKCTLSGQQAFSTA